LAAVESKISAILESFDYAMSLAGGRECQYIQKAVNSLIPSVPGLSHSELAELLNWAHTNDEYFEPDVGDLLTSCVSEACSRLKSLDIVSGWVGSNPQFNSKNGF
jgi:hypothetical protein